MASASKRRRTTSNSKLGLDSEPKDMRRITRFTSRLSDFDARVPILEPGSLLPSPSSLNEGKMNAEENSVEDGMAEGVHEVKHSPEERSRKRVKLEDEAGHASGLILSDLEDLYNGPSTHSMRKRMKTEKVEPRSSTKQDEDEDKPQDSTTLNPKTSTASRTNSRTKSKVKQVPQALAVAHPTPPNWRETYDTIKVMRSRFVAPVDTMGCAQAKTGESEPRNRRYATLVALMLSSQTKDEVMSAAIAKLRATFGGSITLEAMLAADENVISAAISKVGFWRRKTGYLKQAAIKLRDDFNSDVPRTVDELCSLPGVGPKMAFLTLQVAWGLNHGIGVDVHIHRITNLLGWHELPTKNPEQTRLNLQSWLPKELHYDINHVFVGFGQVICLPVSPRCDMCDLSVKGLCPSARKVVTKSKNRKEIVFLDEQGTPADEDGPKVEIVLEEDTSITT